MKTVILTIQPVHLGNIRKGKKLWEIRKNIPNCPVPFKVLCCESKSGGQIKAEFICDTIKSKEWKSFDENLLEECCVEKVFLEFYAEKDEVFLWHISEMIDYCNTKGYSVKNISEFGLRKPPQSWCYSKKEME